MSKSALATRYRTHSCGELRPEHAGPPDPIDPAGDPPVLLCGHVDRLIDDESFVVRDRYGKTLVAVAPEALPHVGDRLRKLGPEDVVQVGGRVEARAEPDPALPTGGVRLLATRLEVLSEAAGVSDEVLHAPAVAYEDRLTRRQLYLRRPDAQARLELRSRVAQRLREQLLDEGFLEIETPQLFLFDPVAIGGDPVPVSADRAFALSGGPVVLNQYVKPGNFDRYFQFATITAVEDEDTPLHAQEYTALDVNMDHVDVPDMCGVIERALAAVWASVQGVHPLPTPFPVLTYQDAMLRYGTDKPDLRISIEVRDLPGAGANGKVVRAFRVPGAADRLNDTVLAALVEADFPDPTKPPPPPDPTKPLSEREELEKKLGPPPAPKPGEESGPPPEERPEIAWARVAAGGAVAGPAAALLAKAEHLEQLGAKPGDLIVTSSGKRPESAAKGAGKMRVALARRLGLVDEKRLAPCWVTAYPLFAWREGQYEPNVVVFATLLEDKDFLLFRDAPDKKHEIRAKAFDLVLDGVEMATGYIGCCSLTIQRLIWEQMFGLARGDLSRMRAPIEAFRFGAAPHGGLNLGFDRLVAKLAGVEAIDEVIAFPKTHACRDLFLGAPAPIPREAAAAYLGEPVGARPEAAAEADDDL